MTSVYCPHCHKHTELSRASAEVFGGVSGTKAFSAWKKTSSEKWWIGVCNACHQPSLVLNDAQVIYPNELPKPSEKDIPDAIRSDLDEAKMCFSVSSYRAAAVMARRAIQVAAKDKGANKEKLIDQIYELKQSGVITSDMKEWADAIRWVGNDAAHPDGEQVTHDDAEDILNLAEQFLHVLYVAPAIALATRTRLGKN